MEQTGSICSSSIGQRTPTNNPSATDDNNNGAVNNNNPDSDDDTKQQNSSDDQSPPTMKKVSENNQSDEIDSGLDELKDLNSEGPLHQSEEELLSPNEDFGPESRNVHRKILSMSNHPNPHHQHYPYPGGFVPLFPQHQHLPQQQLFYDPTSFVPSMYHPQFYHHQHPPPYHHPGGIQDTDDSIRAIRDSVFGC
ncbi:hypothetical protein DERP_010939 [Dermatophagoides pteronyssinus]|uniref:Uncharacterized protein n=1 Tax=Dermatophagoides pteronyssinus TaxID=6956 RepID=A0ABQ8JVN8_DERPT|nr:hypothetical protein DERP_010939 [Dermatophagoides pteronyssinus]